MSMLSRMPFHGGITYSDITIVTSGTLIGNTAITFGTTLLQNDVVFLIIGDNANDYTIPAGYIEVVGEIITGVYRFSCYYKVMGATPDTGIDLADGNDTSGGTYYALRGVQTTSPVIEVNYTVGTNTTTNLTPPALSAPVKSLFLVAGFTGNGSAATLTAAPSGYSGFLTRDVAGNSDTYVGSAYKTISAAGTETPGAFTLTSTATSYAAVSIVVRPYSTSFSSIEPQLISTSSKQNSATGTSLAIPMPSSTSDGDLMIAFVFGAGGSTPGGWTGPSGWTEIAETLSARPLNAVYYRVASSEPGTDYTFTAGTTSRTLAGSILTYRYATYDAISAFATATISPTIPSVTASISQSKLVSAVGQDAANASVSVIGMNAQVTDSGSVSPSYQITDSLLAKGPSGTRNTITSNVSSNGIQLVLKPTRT